jgi:transcriptional regulator with XRE-family HTH domain
MFNILIKELRENNGLTQEEVSKKLNIARATYANYETGKREPNFETLQKIAALFVVSTDYLLGNIPLLKDNERLPFHLNTDGLHSDDVIVIQNLIDKIKQNHKK